MVSLFLLWERYLEKFMDDPLRTPSAWTPPPLMKLSLWTRAKGRMAVILVIALLNWCAFSSWSFWVQVRSCSAAWRNDDVDYTLFKLYYQNYILLTPMQTMLRFIPLFIVGCSCNVFVAMFVGKLPLVIFAGTALCEGYYNT
jgi:hypothetical protein